MLVMLFLLLLAGPVFAADRYVDDTATGSNNGTSWANAFTDLQSAFAAATSGTTIHVAEGTYKPSVMVGGTGDRYKTFQMKNGVAILGGYPNGGGTRDPTAHPAILSGDIGVAGNTSDNCYHVFCHPEGTNLDATAVLDGVTVTGGNADSASWPHCYGGGMYNYESSPTVTDCVFSDNGTGNSASGTYGEGGGIFNHFSAPTLANCMFAGNRTTGRGGAVCNYGSSPTVTNCAFTANSAWIGAGMDITSSSATLTNCTFSRNHATTYAGGLYIQSSSPTLTNCILWGNTAPNGPQMMNSLVSNPVVTYSCIQGGYAGTGNINMDPLFMDANGGDNTAGNADDDLRLQPGSPCIDAGNNSVSSLLFTDLDGNNRQIEAPASPDTGNGIAPIVDMGAYEAPQIHVVVQGNGNCIPNGDPTPSLSDDTDFGLTDVSGGPVTHTFIVRNFATTSLTLTSTPKVVIGGANAADFTVTDPVLSTIPPGGSTTFTVTLNPSGTGMRTATLSIATSDPDETPFTFAIQGSGLRCDLYVDCRKAISVNDGSSWATAFPDLQAGLAAAVPGTTVHVAEGMYRPSVAVGGIGNRYKTFQMKNGVAILGGYPNGGGIRDPAAHPTILSGDIGVAGDPWDNCYHVFYHPETAELNATAALDGFTITGGNADGTFGTFPLDSGGGMFNAYAAPTLNHCTFSGNTASQGGGMCNDAASPTLTHCDLSDNSAVGNISLGGGMCNRDASSPTLTHCAFTGNSGRGSGMYNENSSPTLAECIFRSNTADSGGGMYSIFSSPALTNCTFSGNTASYGGGMENYASSPTLTNCTFSGNTASHGGGMRNYFRSPTLINCILWGNESPDGPQISNYDSSSIPSVTHSCIQGGHAGTGNIGADPLFVDPDGADNTDGTADDDLRLRSGSPCIDAGDNSAPNLPATDLDGNGRLFDDPATPDTGNGTAPIVDMGAYEARASQTIAFAALPDRVRGQVLDLTAVASSGLAVTFISSNPVVAVVNGATVTILGPGTTTITASQSGSGSWAPAAVWRPLTVLDGALMRLWVDDEAGDPVAIEFGEAETAVDGFDTPWDAEAGTVEPGRVDACLINSLVADLAKQRLARDIRPCRVTTRWRLVVSGVTGRGAATLTWDVSAATPGRGVYLQEVRDEQPVGFPIDMHGQTTSRDVTADSEFEIAYSVPAVAPCAVALAKGWNLVGTPVMSTLSAAEILDDGSRAAVHAGALWYWEDGCLQKWDLNAPLSPERGYWVYAPADGESRDVPGVRADGIVLLQPGWNLISPVANGVMPRINGMAGPAWCWDVAGEGAYRAVWPGDAAAAGRAYWIRISSGEPVRCSFP